MPKTKQLSPIEIRLLPDDQVKFEQLCHAKGKRKTELAREAIAWFIDNQEALAFEQRESVLEKRVRKMEERLAALQARTAIDVGMIYHLLYRNMNSETRDEAIKWAYKSSIQRIKKRLSGQDVEVKELMTKKDDQDSSEA